MAGLKLTKLPERTPVKLSVTVSPDLKRALDDYAAIYRDTYGTDEQIVDLVPAILRQFLESDRAFWKARRTADGER